MTVSEGTPLSFTVSASDPDGDPLTYSASNLPTGATFSAATRTFSWTPPLGSAGTYSIHFAVSDGRLSVSQVATLSVTPKQWRVRAISGAGGKISPSGDLYVQTGSTQLFTLTADKGFVVQNLRVNGALVGARDTYILSSVNSDQILEAFFQPIPAGLSFVAGDTGIPGIERVDGGSDANNFIGGTPNLNVEYLFRVVYRDASVQSPLKVFLKLNGYAFEMAHAEGEIGTGATYVYKTRLGPAPAHAFRFEARDPTGNILWTLPQQGFIAGPSIELLPGRNLVGVPGDSSSTYLNATAALGTASGYRWFPGGVKTAAGTYRLIDSTGAVRFGEGYLMNRGSRSTLPEPGHREIAAGTASVPLKAGWNLIANPYRGNVPLAHIRVKRGSATPVPWATAVANGWIDQHLYQYQGNEGDIYGFETALPVPTPPVVAPWMGYWVYLKRTDTAYSLIFPRPQQ